MRKMVAIAVAAIVALIATPALARWDEIKLCEVSFPC